MEDSTLDPIQQNVVGRTCDLCGEVCESTQELNLLDCTFEACSQAECCYHQDCLERYLKSIRCERNRKTGFKCPRGCSKQTTFDKPCPGKIDKSHPIHPRAEATKRRKKAVALPPPPPPAKPAAKPAAKAADSKPVSAAAPAKPASPAKPAVVVAAAKPVAVPPKVAAALTASAKAAAAAKAAVMTREALAAAAASMRRELGLGGGGGGGGAGSAGGQRAAPEPPQSLHTQFAPAPPPTREASMGLSMRDFLPRFADSAPAQQQQPPPTQAAAAGAGNAWAARPAAGRAPAPAPPPAPPRASFDASATGWAPLPGSSAAGPAPGFAPAPPPMMSRAVAPSAPNGAQHAPPPALGAYGGALAGADEDDEDDDGFSDPKSRAARKGERKRDKRRAGGLEPAPGAAAAVPPAAATVQQRLTATLVARKTAMLAHQLAPMGFPPALCAAAVRRHGADLDGAASWLLEAAASGADATGSAVADMPVHEELAAVDDIASLCGCARDHVAEVVILAGGDLDATVLAIMEPASVRAMPVPQPQQQQPPPQQQQQQQRPPSPPQAGAYWGTAPRGLAAAARGGWPVPEQPRTPPQEPVMPVPQPVAPRGLAFASAASEAAAAQPRQAQPLAPLAPQPRDESRFARNFSSNSLSGYSAHALGGSGSGSGFDLGASADDAVGRFPPPGFSAQASSSAGGLFSNGSSGGAGAVGGGLFSSRTAVGSGGNGAAYAVRGGYDGLGPLSGSSADRAAPSLGAFSGLGLSAFSSDPLASAFRAAPPGFSGGAAAAAPPADAGLWGAPAAPSARPRLSRLAGYGVSAVGTADDGGGAVPQAALLAAAAVADGKNVNAAPFRAAPNAHDDELSSLLATLMRGR